ncbi:MAG: phosphonopyruvate decarboxylase [Proteobacteria bacterium]|nr:phosphonopyruvate decarboxylase [Pseudomonadota bacterium]
MIKADAFLDQALAAGYDFYTGVPCSFLTPVINRVITRKDIRYVPAASEGEATAIAAGAWLAGRKTVLICQNSGLGNAINPLTSLNHPFRIPTLMIVTWRGQPGLKDEPQHVLMGQITDVLLNDIGVPNEPFPSEDADIAPALDRAFAHMDSAELPYAFIMANGSVAPEGLEETPALATPGDNLNDYTTGGDRPTRCDTLERLLKVTPDNAGIVCTTGKSGRELFTIDDRKQHIYQVGSMGSASAMGLGIAVNVDRPIVVIDGDGAALMKMGNMATIGAQEPRNLIHVLVDNGVHDSTGGQATVSGGVDFARIALACGYASAASADDLGGFEKALKAACASDGPHMVHIRIQPGSLEKLGRPTVSPDAVARRFKAFLASTA